MVELAGSESGHGDAVLCLANVGHGAAAIDGCTHFIVACGSAESTAGQVFAPVIHLVLGGIGHQNVVAGSVSRHVKHYGGSVFVGKSHRRRSQRLGGQG